MTIRLARCLAVTLVLALVTLLTPADRAVAQKKKPAANPFVAPALDMVFPCGIQRGTTLDLVLTGNGLDDPIQLATSIPDAKVTIPTEGDNGKDAKKLTVKLEVPKDAPLGFHTLRLITGRGLSKLRLFCVDDLPQVMQDEKNRSADKAQAVTIPSVVCGKMKAEGGDFYKITVTAGQRVTFEVLGRRLGSGFDPELRIYDAKGEEELVYNNDAPGLQTDPRIIHTFKDAGDYLVEVRDTMYRGGPDFAYRLRVGDFPCATNTVPMAAKRGSKTKVQFAGPQVEGIEPVEVEVPDDPMTSVIWLTPKGANGQLGWPVPLFVSDLDEAVEKEPNNEPNQASPVPVPGAVTGRFVKKDEKDFYLLPLKKGRWIIEAHTTELQSPTHVYMSLKNAKGADVAKTDPQQAARIDYNAPEDGNYTLRAEHLLYWGGPSEVYRITVTPYEPGFEIALATDRYDLPQGTAALVNVQKVTRRDFKGPIELSVVGPDGITGKASIKDDKAPPQNQPFAVLVVGATPEVPVGVHSFRIQAKATINGKEVKSFASVRDDLTKTSLSGLPFPPRQLYEEANVAVTEKPPFTLALKFDNLESFKGTPIPLTLTATRSEGFTEEITIPSAVSLPPAANAALKGIPKDQNEVKVQINTNVQATPLGSYPISVLARTRYKDRDYQFMAPPVDLVLVQPFELKVEPAKLELEPGAKAMLKVTATRKGGYAGPITLEVQNLPALVTAPKVTLEKDQTEAEIEVTAGDKAQPVEKNDVKIQGTATAASNVQNPSGNFQVKVAKK